MRYSKKKEESRKIDIAMAVAAVLAISVSILTVLGSLFAVFQQFASLHANSRSLEEQINQVDGKLAEQIKQLDGKLDGFIAEIRTERKEVNQLRVEVAELRGQVKVLTK